MKNRPEHLTEMIAPPGKFYYGANNELLVPDGITIFYLSSEQTNPPEEARNYYVKVDDYEILPVYSESQLFPKSDLARSINNLTQHYSDYKFPDNSATANPEAFQLLLKKIEASSFLKEFIADTYTKIQNDGWNNRTNEEIPVASLLYTELFELEPVEQRLLGIEKFNYAEHISKYTISLNRETFETNFKNKAIELKPKTSNMTADELLAKYNYSNTLHNQVTQTPSVQPIPTYNFDDQWVDAAVTLEVNLESKQNFAETRTSETTQMPQENPIDEKTLLFEKLCDKKFAFKHVIFLIEKKMSSTERNSIMLYLDEPAHTALSNLTPEQRKMLGIGDLQPYGTSQYKTLLSTETAKEFLKEFKQYKEIHRVNIEKKKQQPDSKDADELEKMKQNFQNTSKHYNPRKFHLNAGQKIKYIEDENSKSSQHKRRKK